MVVQATATTLTVKVPEGATTGVIQVKVGNNEASSETFTVRSIKAIRDYPTSGMVGKVYPNPSSHQIIIPPVSLAESATVWGVIYSLQGVQVSQEDFQEQTNGNHKLQWTHNLPAGMYLLNIKVSGTDHRQKIVIW